MIFDLDGTLVPTEPLYSDAVCQSLSELGCQFTASDYCRHVGVPVRDILARQGLPVALALRGTRRARELFRQRIGSLQPVPGVRGFLRQTTRLPRAVATGCDRDTASVLLRAMGLLEFFDAVVTVDDVWPEPGKPAPAVYRLAAERLRVPAAHCWAFEDSLPGIAAAGRAGMTVVGLSTTLAPSALEGAHHVIADFTDQRLLDWCVPAAGGVNAG
ncbi:MAG TPA: HAD family phosphatase [Polyangiaceae bacterium]|nr:HAD family phosphatase [Polyangiaceae bacterium]